MSMTLPIDNLVSIVRIFDYHISNVVDTLGGYVLKYAGDAVISFFPSRIDNQNKYLSSDTAVESGKLMINSIKEEVNSFMHKIYKYPRAFSQDRNRCGRKRNCSVRLRSTLTY